MKQIFLYKAFYCFYLNKYSRMPNEIDLIILYYIMDLHYTELKTIFLNDLNKYKIIYLNRIYRINNLFERQYPKPIWFKSDNIKSLSKFLRVMLKHVHIFTGIKFYKSDLDLIGVLLNSCCFILIDQYKIVFNTKRGYNIILNYDIYDLFLNISKLNKKLKFDAVFD